MDRLKFEKTEVWGLEQAIRIARASSGMRGKSDSGICKGGDSGIGCGNCSSRETCAHPFDYTFRIGRKDMDLLQKRILDSVDGGNEHSGFLRRIMVNADITAPLYWWKEVAQYQGGFTSNIENTMHKLFNTPITADCFEQNEVTGRDGHFLSYIDHLEELRSTYRRTGDGEVRRALLALLPESWLQTRITTFHYQELRRIYFDQKKHRLEAWPDCFIGWMGSLPYAGELIMYDGKEAVRRKHKN